MIYTQPDGTPAFHGHNIIGCLPIMGSNERVMTAEYRHSDTHGWSYVTFLAGPENTSDWMYGHYFDAWHGTSEREARNRALLDMVDRSGVTRLAEDGLTLTYRG